MEAKMNLSFREKSLWLMFVGLMGVFTFYFATVLPSNAIDLEPPQMAIFVLVVVIQVIVSVMGHIVIAVADRRMATDERDRSVELKGKRNGSYVLATGVFFALCIPLFTTGTFVFTHVLLGFWVLAQLVEIGSQLFLLRRGA
jgi:hypothetical protein